MNARIFSLRLDSKLDGCHHLNAHSPENGGTTMPNGHEGALKQRLDQWRFFYLEDRLLRERSSGSRDRGQHALGSKNTTREAIHGDQLGGMGDTLLAGKTRAFLLILMPGFTRITSAVLLALRDRRSEVNALRRERIEADAGKQADDQKQPQESVHGW